MEAGILINLYEDEKILLVIRRHWLAFLESILITFLLLLVFVVGFFILNSRLNSPISAVAQCLTTPLITDNMGKGALVIFSSVYLLATCAFFYISWLDYYMDVFLITNKRILRVEQLVLFGQNISETSLQHVQDVSSRVKGILYTILNVGTVFIETAGDRSNFNFNFIKNPSEVAAQILELQKEMWGDEGFKEDLTLERANEKIKQMNTGGSSKDVLTKEEAIFTKPLKEPHRLMKKMLAVRDKLGKIKFKVGAPKEKETVETQDLEPIKETVQEQKPLIQNQYTDGRKITPNGVIWQSEQEINDDVLNTLNEMEG